MKGKVRRIPDWLDDIRETIENIRADVGTLTKPEFLEDGKSQRAAIVGLIDIGEVANNIMKLTPGLKQVSPEAWRHLDDVYAMRIRLTHTYHRTNSNIVFDTVRTDLPELERILDRIKATENDGIGDSNG
jgi:uncharacterized protein with HEPN domain